MNKELIDRAWRCLPREFREAAKKYYHTLHEQYKDYEGLHFQNAKAKVQERMVTLNYFFGLHNLTSDAEGEEMLTCEKCKVTKLYNKFQKDGTFTCLYAAGVLDTLFGAKCLPDEEPKPAEPELRSDGTAHFDNIITNGFRDHNRLQIAAMAMQGALANPNIITSGSFFENDMEYICNMALDYADTLIEAASKNKDK